MGERIDSRAVYLTPLGRRAMLDESCIDKRGSKWLTFRYVGPDATLFGGGFVMTHANALRLLREVEVRRAATR